MGGDRSLTTTVCVVGCGPAGALLGLLLARSGIDVVVLEKHADFLRDFRGDTVHPSTIEVLAEIGLADRFLAAPHRKVSTIGFVHDGRRIDTADFRTLGLRYPYIAFVPQWDFLTLLTAEAARHPNFRLILQAEAHGLARTGGRITGVRFRAPDGDHEVRAHLVVGADGRHSAVRCLAGMRAREFGAPMDVVMFRLSRRDTDPDEGYHIRMGGGRPIVVIDRGSYWNIAHMISKGGHDEMRRKGITVLRDDIAQLVAFLGDRVDELAGFEDTRFLQVRVNPLRRWHAPGLLLIGDAAHAMSPIGGVGVNLAIQDAVATSNILTAVLHTAQRGGGPVSGSALAAVQRRRWLPTMVTQAFQRVAQRFAIDRVLRGEAAPDVSRIVRIPLVQALAGRLVGVGVRPEHVRTPDMSSTHEVP